MPSLATQGKVQNFKASIEKYIQDNIETKEEIKVAYEGEKSENFQENEWVEEFIVDIGSGEFGRGGGDEGDAVILMPLIQFNIFVNRGNTKKTNRHYEIRDIVAKYFCIGAEIDLYDFENNNFDDSLQKMKVRTVEDDLTIRDPNYYQYTYSVTIEWLERMT